MTVNNILADHELLDLIERCEKARRELDAAREEVARVTEKVVLPALDAAADYLAELRERRHTDTEGRPPNETDQRRARRDGRSRRAETPIDRRPSPV
jgi:hypothetical protein